MYSVRPPCPAKADPAGVSAIVSVTPDAPGDVLAASLGAVLAAASLGARLSSPPVGLAEG
jgi:hypothetical protein